VFASYFIIVFELHDLSNALKFSVLQSVSQKKKFFILELFIQKTLYWHSFNI